MMLREGLQTPLMPSQQVERETNRRKIDSYLRGLQPTKAERRQINRYWELVGEIFKEQ